MHSGAGSGKLVEGVWSIPWLRSQKEGGKERTEGLRRKGAPQAAPTEQLLPSMPMRGSRWTFHSVSAYRNYLRVNSKGIQKLMQDLIEHDDTGEVGRAQGDWIFLDQGSAEVVRVRKASRNIHGGRRKDSKLQSLEHSVGWELRKAFLLLKARAHLWPGGHPPIFCRFRGECS